MPIEGVDFSYSHPSVAGLAAAGKKFACRYLTGTTSAAPGSKNLTPTEAKALRAAGIGIVSNYETSVGFMLEGYDSGARRAEAAWKQHTWCGGPDGRPIYFSLDMNATYDQWKQAREFLRGAASAIGWGQVGMYGGLFQVDWAHDELGMRWLWQALGWSYGQVSPHIVLHQYRNGVTMAGGTVDLDRALTSDYGQWGGPMSATGPEQWDSKDWDAYIGRVEKLHDKYARWTARWVDHGDETVLGTGNNLARVRGDLDTLTGKVDAGLKVTLDVSQLTPDQLALIGRAAAGALVIEGVAVKDGRLILTIPTS